MKKAIKIISLLMALILALSMFTGCAPSDEEGFEEEEMEVLSMTIGIPVSTSDEEWADWEPFLAYLVDDFATYYSFDINFTRVPTEAKALKKFMKKVDSGKVACFFSSREDFIETLIEDESLLPLKTIRDRYTALLEEAPAGIFSIAEEKSLDNYVFPIYGTFQGLYYNRTLFKELGIENPTSWENLMADIEAIKAKGIIPIAAGFADEGLEYMVDEMILTEGGTAEHSYQPTFGVISSWERAVNDIKTLENLGAFTPDCYNVNFEDAVQSFLDGKAAMIVAPSDAFGGMLPVDDVKVVGFPKTASGKREDGAFIGRINHGIYISKAYYSKPEARYAEALCEIVGTDYFGSADFYEIFKDESNFNVNGQYYSEIETTHYEDSLANLVKNATAADWTMRERALSFDTTVECFRKALTGTDVTAALQEATDAEIAAAEAAAAEEK